MGPIWEQADEVRIAVAQERMQRELEELAKQQRR